MLITLLVVTAVASLVTAATISRCLGHQRVVVGTVAAVAGGLVTARVIWLLITGLFIATAVELWPLSRRQGPDTAFSRSCYAEFLGEAPPADVTDVPASERGSVRYLSGPRWWPEHAELSRVRDVCQRHNRDWFAGQQAFAAGGRL